MTRFGVTGHQMRPGVDWGWVRREVRRVLGTGGPEAVLWSSLATGADTVAAEEALAAGLSLGVVIPHEGYERVYAGADRAAFDRLFDAASQVVSIGPRADRESAYLDAGRMVADRSDLLLVVWDGRPAAGRGGTGDIAEHARARDIPVVWLDTTRSEVRAFRQNREVASGAA